jgi:transposase
VTLDHRHVLNAIVSVAEQGGTWRGRPTRFGNWHTIDTRMNRWSKTGVLARVLAPWQQTQILRVKIEAVAVDRPSVKVQPEGTGALHKTARPPWVSPAADGPPRVIGLPRMLERPLSPGQAHDAPEGRTLLHRLGNMPRPVPLVMDRA